MTGLIDRSVKGLRKLITELRPEVLENLGLVTAIEWQGNEFKNKSGIDCKFETAVHDQSADGAAAGSCHFIHFVLGVQIVRQQQ